MIKIEEVTYKTFGRCLSMTNGKIQLFATLDFGPRIIRFAKEGGENFMLEDGDFSINQQKDAALFVEKFGKDAGVFYNYGGHRLWTSPEALPRTYYPDNEPVSYTFEDGFLTLTPPPQKWTQQQLEIKIVMSETENKVDVYHKITNIGAWPQKFAPWALTVLAPGGIEIIPMPDRPTRLLHNRKIALWDYAKMNDPRVTWGDKYIILTQDPTAATPFKFGIDSQHGWAAYFNNGDALIKKFDVLPDAEYPDDGMNFESYNCGAFIEMESIGEYKVIEPDEAIIHHESWELVPDMPYPGNDEGAIATAMAPYVD
ncbi:MAG: hypothetical protein J6A56_03980 [Clostridia bacterium]|nr:hypothetical protein [Clostridia bacterium]